MQLKEPPLVKPDVNELHPDVNTGEHLIERSSLFGIYGIY
jgi:hypothetical protein